MAESRKFFVIIPVYKVEKYISSCIDSVLAQDNGNFRIIAVDDGTPDRSGEICDAYAEKDERITVIHKENGGLASARAAGIAVSLKEADSDDFVIFLDSDDTLSHNTLSTIDRTVSENDCDLVIYSMRRVFDEKYEGLVKPYPKSYVGAITDKGELYRTVFTDSQYNSMCRKAMSARLLRKAEVEKIHHIGLVEDLLQSIPLYRYCEKAVFIPDPLYNYTYNPCSMTHTVCCENYSINSSVRKATLEFLREQAVWSDSDFEAYLKYCRQILREQIATVCRFNASTSDKAQILEKIRTDEYCSYIISTVKDSDWELLYVGKRRYRALIFKSAVRAFLSRIYHTLRG